MVQVDWGCQGNKLMIRAATEKLALLVGDVAHASFFRNLYPTFQYSNISHLYNVSLYIYIYIEIYIYIFVVDFLCSFSVSQIRSYIYMCKQDSVVFFISGRHTSKLSSFIYIEIQNVLVIATIGPLPTPISYQLFCFSFAFSSFFLLQQICISVSRFVLFFPHLLSLFFRPLHP